MEIKDMTAILVVAMVGCILIAGFLPVVNSSTAETLTYENEGMPYKAVDEDTHTLIFTANNINVDGVDIDLTKFPGTFTNYTVVYSEHGFIRWDKTNVMYSCNIEDTTAVGSYNCSSYTVTVTIVADVATITSTDADATTRQIEDVVYYIANKGDYVLSVNPFVTNETNMMGAGITVFTSPEFINLYFIWEGTPTDININAYHSGAGYTAEYVDYNVNTTPKTTNLFKIDSILFNFELTKSDNTYDVTATYTYFIVPAEIVYQNPNYVGDTSTASIISLIPFVLIMGIVLMFVGVVIVRRYV